MHNWEGCMGTTQERSYQLDFYKLLFAICIFCLHTIVTFEPADSVARDYVVAWGNICVNFFFVISGILMVNSYYKRRDTYETGKAGRESLRFVIGKLKGLAVIYYTNFAINFVIESVHIFEGSDGVRAGCEGVCALFVHAIPELLAIEMIGIRPVGINNATWYVSAMLIAMIPLFYLLIKHTDVFINVIAPITAFGLLAFFYREGAVFCNHNDWYLICTGGVLRALCGLCFGVVCWLISEKLRRLSRSQLPLLTLYEVIAFVFLVVFMLFIEKDINNVYPALLITMPLLSVAFSGSSVFKTAFQIRAFRFFNSWSMYIYFTHTAATKVIKYWIVAPKESPSLLMVFALMIGITFAFCLITWIVSRIVKTKRSS